jgi:5-methylcytosine-specific restriction protein B
MKLGASTLAKVEEVVGACRDHGSDSIIVLSGVAGTGKTLIALAAAQKHAGHPLFVRQIQFHQSYAYEDFIEGLRPTLSGGFEGKTGLFLDWNEAALRDSSCQYVLVIEELTRANISSVIGELMTFIEYRDRVFETPITGRRVRVAPNLTILATMNPRDRSALEVDDALLRRLRIVSCPPSTEQLKEMLSASLEGGGNVEPGISIITTLARLFDECHRRHPETFDEQMPFGHGMFSGVRTEEDLRSLWHQRIHHILKRPQVPPHPYYADIVALYPWRS